MITVVNLVDEVIMNFNDEEQLEKIAEKVNILMEGRPLFNT
jgi:glycine hydroxymethyltransferase